jgi:hypothetical protein
MRFLTEVHSKEMRRNNFLKQQRNQEDWSVLQNIQNQMILLGKLLCSHPKMEILNHRMRLVQILAGCQKPNENILPCNEISL